MGCAKIILYIFNIIFLLAGGVCLGLGIWVLVDNQSLLQVTRIAQDATNFNALDIPSFIEGAAIGLAIGGGIVFFISFLGFCGACKEISACLYMYSFLVILILVAEVTAVVLAAIYYTEFQTYATKYMLAALLDKYVGPYATTNVISVAFDSVFISLACCGINNYTDFSLTTKWNTTYIDTTTGVNVVAQIPLTCCKFSDTASFPSDMTKFLTSMTDKNCPVTMAESNADTGCYQAIESAVITYSYAAIGIGAGILLLELIVVISACLVIREIKQKNSGVV